MTTLRVVRMEQVFHLRELDYRSPGAGRPMRVPVAAAIFLGMERASKISWNGCFRNWCKRQVALETAQRHRARLIVANMKFQDRNAASDPSQLLHG
jgi:hypothetical protein